MRTLFLFLLTLQLNAQSIMMSVAHKVAPSITEQYNAILAKASAESFTAPSTGQQTNQNALIAALIAADAWDYIDVMLVFANDGSGAFGRINWKTPASYLATLVNSPTWTSNVGYKSNGFSSYINTTWAPSNGVNYTQNSAGFFVGVATDAENASSSVFGTEETNNQRRLQLRPRRTGGAADGISSAINNSVVHSGTGIVTNSIGIYAGIRTASNAYTIYKDNTSIFTSSQGSSALCTRPVFVCANNLEAGPGEWDTRDVQFIIFGSGWDSTKRTAIYNALVTYLGTL